MAGRSTLSILAIAVALFGTTVSAVTVNAPCGNRGGVENFNLDAFRGTWYEMFRYPNFFQRDAECVNTEVYIETNDVNMRMYHSMVVFEPDFTILHSTMYGKVAFPNDPPQGSFNISYTGTYDRTNFIILDTDYSDYAVAWSCSDNADNTSEQMAWVFSRYYYVRAPVQNEVDSSIDQHLQRNLLRETFNDDHYCLGGEISPAK